jgi:hypothetical protein
MAATHTFALTMVDGHSSGYGMEVRLPRVDINPRAYGFSVIMDGQRPWHFSYVFLREPEQSQKAPGAALLWSFLTVSLQSERILQGWGLLYASRKAPAFFLLSPSGGDRLLVQPLLIWFHFISTLRIIGKPRISFSFSAMVRHRRKPRRGSAWAEHKEQRRREEELERALALASSILRKRAWAEGRTELDSIIEQGFGCSRVGKEADSMLPFPSCVVEEDTTLGNLPSN